MNFSSCHAALRNAGPRTVASVEHHPPDSQSNGLDHRGVSFPRFLAKFYICRPNWRPNSNTHRSSLSKKHSSSLACIYHCNCSHLQMSFYFYGLPLISMQICAISACELIQEWSKTGLEELTGRRTLCTSLSEASYQAVPTPGGGDLCAYVCLYVCVYVHALH